MVVGQLYKFNGGNKMQEALNEWLIMDDENMKFHMGQYETPYRSTVKFAEFLHEHLKSTKNNYICDLGCGAGAVLYYILGQHKTLFGGARR
jgi:predicted RNA methylase